ncbi:hypothetical protein PRZ48_002037 [Zasmidium cellare]|uniref:Uncharacterized protein n=1 Tax=Zasmidium cellare TaxID=395010 RepID=A0ABR0F2W7_ZASCE|nr:hypothetical protein PRZ48_002037 [Zasmidium cellare]
MELPQSKSQGNGHSNAQCIRTDVANRRYRGPDRLGGFQLHLSTPNGRRPLFVDETLVEVVNHRPIYIEEIFVLVFPFAYTCEEQDPQESPLFKVESSSPDWKTNGFSVLEVGIYNVLQALVTMEIRFDDPIIPPQQDWECPICCVDKEPTDEQFLLRDERRPGDEEVDRGPHLYCGDSSRLVYNVADDRDGSQCGKASPEDDHDCPDRQVPNDEVPEDEQGAIPSRNFQMCPNCHTYVQLSGACNAMLDGNVTGPADHAPGQWPKPPEDRPVLHNVVKTDEFEALKEWESEWRDAAEALDRHLQGLDSITALFMEPSHQTFMRQLVLSGRNMCRLLHNGFDQGHEHEKFHRRLEFAHLSATCRQYLVHLKLFYPNTLSPQEMDTKWRTQYPTFEMLYQDLLPLRLTEAAFMQGQRDLDTLRTSMQHIATNTPLPTQHSQETPLTLDDDINELITELARILSKIFEVFPIPKDDRGENEGIALEPVQRVLLQHHYRQLKTLVQSPRFTAAPNHRLQTREVDQTTVLQVTAFVANQLFETEDHHPQEEQEKKTFATFIADRDWARDMCKTLSPFESDLRSRHIAIPEHIKDVSRAVRGLCNEMNDSQEPSLSAAQKQAMKGLNKIISRSLDKDLQPPILKSIIMHAGHISQGLLDMRQGIFGNGDDDNPLIGLWRGHLTWAQDCEARFNKMEETTGFIYQDRRRVWRVVQAVVPLLEWFGLKTEGKTEPPAPDDGDHRFLVLRSANVPGYFDYEKEVGEVEVVEDIIKDVIPMIYFHNKALNINVDLPSTNVASWTADRDWLRELVRGYTDPVLHDTSASMLYLLDRLLNPRPVHPKLEDGGGEEPDDDQDETDRLKREDRKHLTRDTRWRLMDATLNRDDPYHPWETRYEHAPRLKRVLSDVVAAAAESEDINPGLACSEPANCQRIRDQLRQIDTEHRLREIDPPLEYLEALDDMIWSQQWPRAPWPESSKGNFSSDLLGRFRRYIVSLKHNQETYPDDEDRYLPGAAQRASTGIDILRFDWPCVYPLGDVRRLLPRLWSMRRAIQRIKKDGWGHDVLANGDADIPLPAFLETEGFKR